MFLITGSFKSMYNVVHIDVKMVLHIQKNRQTIIFMLIRKNHIVLAKPRTSIRANKVMCLVAATRLRFDEEGNKVFSEKIGMFPLVNNVPTISSKF